MARAPNSGCLTYLLGRAAMTDPIGLRWPAVEADAARGGLVNATSGNGLGYSLASRTTAIVTSHGHVSNRFAGDGAC